MVSCFTNTHETKLERLSRDKHSSLLRTFVNYGRKKFYNIGPMASKTKKKVFMTPTKCHCLKTDAGQNKLQRLDPGKHFQVRMAFAIKARRAQVRISNGVAYSFARKC